MFWGIYSNNRPFLPFPSCSPSPVPGKNLLQVLTFGHIRFSVATLPFPNLKPKPNHVFPWRYLPNLISESFEREAGQSVTMFWNMYTRTLSAVWSCWFYREGPLVKHGDCLYNNIATVTSNRCLDCVSFAAVKFIIVLSCAGAVGHVCMCQCLVLHTPTQKTVWYKIIKENSIIK